MFKSLKRIVYKVPDLEKAKEWYSSILGYTHAWVYYVLGAGGTQLARWHGRQTSDSAGPEDCGRRVYMYPHSYLTNGGELTVYPDFTKEFHITDALGSVRTVIKTRDGLISCQGFDYKPFGDSLSFDKDLPRQSFGSEERDEEMGYYQMGRRLYDPAIGRFMAVDPLFESFPTQSPYAYAFNSPLSWSDPSGLAPEKERKRDRVQNFDMNEYWIGYGLLQRSIAWLEDERSGNYYEEMNYRQNMHFLAQSYSSRLGECGGGGGGNKVENGQNNKNSPDYIHQKYKNKFNDLAIIAKDNKNTKEWAFCVWEDNEGKEYVGDLYSLGEDESISPQIPENCKLIAFAHCHSFEGSDFPSPEDFIATATKSGYFGFLVSPNGDIFSFSPQNAESIINSIGNDIKRIIQNRGWDINDNNVIYEATDRFYGELRNNIESYKIKYQYENNLDFKTTSREVIFMYLVTQKNFQFNYHILKNGTFKNVMGD